MQHHDSWWDFGIFIQTRLPYMLSGTDKEYKKIGRKKQSMWMKEKEGKDRKKKKISNQKNKGKRDFIHVLSWCLAWHVLCARRVLADSSPLIISAKSFRIKVFVFIFIHFFFSVCCAVCLPLLWLSFGCPVPFCLRIFPSFPFVALFTNFFVSVYSLFFFFFCICSESKSVSIFICFYQITRMDTTW